MRVGDALSVLFGGSTDLEVSQRRDLLRISEEMGRAKASRGNIVGWELERLGALDLRVGRLEAMREGEWKNVLARFDADYAENMRNLKEVFEQVLRKQQEVEKKVLWLSEEQFKLSLKLKEGEVADEQRADL